jgi:lipid-binding SYLF domain-containing protein
MGRTTRNFLYALMALVAVGVQGTAFAQADQETRLLNAAQVLDELRGQRDQMVPEWLMQRAYGVAVVPKVLKGALFLGARRGNGVLTVRDNRGRFSNPIFVNLTGGSFGLQFGAQETDIVLVFTTRKGIEGIADGKLTLGAGASVAAGPVGRQAEVAASTTAEVYAYSRARGLFAGIALDGTAISIDTKSNRAFYGKKDVLASDITSGAVTRDSENSRRFLAALARSTGESADGKAEAAPGTSAAAPADHAAHGGEVQTFPMEDPAPGQEPR